MVSVHKGIARHFIFLDSRREAIRDDDRRSQNVAEVGVLRLADVHFVHV
jgi:hypothetical protein